MIKAEFSPLQTQVTEEQIGLIQLSTGPLFRYIWHAPSRRYHALGHNLFAATPEALAAAIVAQIEHSATSHG